MMKIFTHVFRKKSKLLLWGILAFLHLWLRSHHALALTHQHRVYSFNWIPFSDFTSFIENQGPIILCGKIAFYVIMGVLLASLLDGVERKKSGYVLLSGITIIIEELLNFYFNNQIMIFDINNVLLYAVGLLIGWWVYKGFRKFTR